MNSVRTSSKLRPDTTIVTKTQFPLKTAKTCGTSCPWLTPWAMSTPYRTTESQSCSNTARTTPAKNTRFTKRIKSSKNTIQKSTKSVSNHPRPSRIPAPQTLVVFNRPRKGAPGSKTGLPVCPSTRGIVPGRGLCRFRTSSSRLLRAGYVYVQVRGGGGATGTVVVVCKTAEVQGADGLLHCNPVVPVPARLLPVSIQVGRSGLRGLRVGPRARGHGETVIFSAEFGALLRDPYFKPWRGWIGRLEEAGAACHRRRRVAEIGSKAADAALLGFSACAAYRLRIRPVR